jgi:hypothetical protein
VRSTMYVKKKHMANVKEKNSIGMSAFK